MEDSGARLDFVFANEQKRRTRFACGLFFDHAALHHGRFRYPFSRRLAVLKESPLSTTEDHRFLRRNYGVVFTHRKALLDRGLPFRELLHGTNWVPEAVAEARGRGSNVADAARKTRLCSFIGNIEHDNRPGYALRKAAADLAAARGADCYGKGIRPVERKVDALSSYCFSVAMENAREDYYFTEKLIDCFLTDTVPVYWGCPGIARFFDERGILAFETLEDLERLIPTLSIEQYRAALPHAAANRKRCFDLMVADYEGFFRRLGAALSREEFFRSGQRGLAPWRRGKAMAAVRSLCHRGAGCIRGAE